MVDEASADTNAQTGSLKGRFAPAAKQRITDFLESFETFEPTLGLLYGDLEGDVAGGPSWSMTAFDPRTVEDTLAMYASFGAVVRYELDGFDVLIPQVSHAKELDSGVLDFIDNRIRPAGAAAS
jgi:hypothetical protein